MSETEINLTDEERSALQEIAQQSGKTESQLIHEAVDHFIREFQKKDNRAFMQKARGIWKNRQDLPELEELRREWNRA
jgi:predicted transcriptional regulator